MITIISLILLFLAGITKAFMDVCAENNLPFKGVYFSKTESWKNKWKSIDNNLVKSKKGDNWWYLGIINPKYKEKFPFSSTFLVFTTDFWHLSQFFFLKFIIIGSFIFQPLTHSAGFDLLIIYATLLIPFELTHSYLKKSNK